MLGGTVHAADPVASQGPSAVAPPTPVPSDWRFQATLYGWLTAIDGDVGVRNLPTVPVHDSIVDVLGDLDGAFMGTFMARNGQFLLLLDVVAARLSAGRQVGTYGGSSADVDLSQTIVTGAVGYLLPTGRSDMDFALTGGVRYMRLSADVSLTPFALPTITSDSQSKSWVDPTIGFVAHWTINEKWFVNATADIGGFDVGSKLSSNGYVGLGYMWTKSISSAIGYRYLYEDYEGAGNRTGAFRYNAVMHGPTVSVAWHF
ncbi:hypothetical protein GCM10007301_24660 [Azorhizobium oxalatiphilum]|uniref:Outer membrane protein beta-barrel domain-containing protein n=2 Tax=Azorhizobium oxalatiphilum TaxID=980631 RepID=A0A917BZZ6_9HYPH|nr:hypothetical protein GCM10007301_24660 [Azorhizobium oxalatiphilum]